MASVNRQQEKAVGRRQGETIVEWLSKPNLPVKRGELWWWLNHYEAKRRAASPLWRMWARLRIGLQRINPFKPKLVALDAGQKLPKPESITDGDHTPDPAIETTVRRTFDVNGRLVDES